MLIRPSRQKSDSGADKAKGRLTVRECWGQRLRPVTTHRFYSLSH